MAPRAACLLPLLLIASATVILVDATCGVVDTTSCDDNPATLCKDCDGPADKVPNPLDCSTYYMCKNSSNFIFDDPLSCPDGQIFNMNNSKCSPDAECQFSCGSTSEDGCFYTCNNDMDGMIADPFDCSVYHQCTGTSGTDPGPAQTCPADKPYFGGKECVADESACCHCRPYCYEGDQYKKVEDPTDCRKFFFCLENHEMPTIPGECKDGEHFDLHAGDCSNTAPCVTLCRNVVDGDGCIDPYTCQELGYFPKCKTQCLREYYHCVEVSDDYATPETCPNNLVFNPDTLTCIKNETCPYTHK
ncbi:uncharacterized protein LOC123504925 [Portunus trituberculatus]|uniref:uncharacterized protein LOC123504925 n=1 Tax=Portunus trituberculatus TaxID=210409 RepID=UPI001E1CF831|nr:uncharacterized protein LOC123504925 [Portunus trituberculatus]